MICAACGFETPQEQGYCDFCKEPFKKRPASEPVKPPPAAAPPRGEHPAPEVKLTPEILGKLLGAKDAAAGDARAGEIPPEFAHLDTGGQVPEIPPAARKLAWVFLGILMFWILLGTVWMLMNADTIAANASQKTRPPAARRSQ